MSRKIIDKNLEIMLSTSNRGMRSLIPEATIYRDPLDYDVKNEWNIIPCVFNYQTGEIAGFYLGTIPIDLRSDLLSMGNVKIRRYSGIITDYNFSQEKLPFIGTPKEVTPPTVVAEQLLDETVAEYNHMIPHVVRAETTLREQLIRYHESLKPTKKNLIEIIRQRLKF